MNGIERLAKKLNFSRDKRGVAAVEFAIVANVFMMLVTGVTGFGIFLSASHSLQQMSAEAARAAVAGIGVTEQTAFAQAHIEQITSKYPFIDIAKVESTVTYPTPSQITVTISYDRADLPVIKFLRLMDLQTGTLSASSTIRVES